VLPVFPVGHWRLIIALPAAPGAGDKALNRSCGLNV
jgi:hypothetical protein